MLVLCILDGVGINTDGLKIPFIERNLKDGYLLKATGSAVGLADGQMGNSEVGHITIGAGRVIKQLLPRIDNTIANHSLMNMIQPLLGANNTIHIVGLLSNGGVHAHIDHILYIIKQLKGVHKIFIHAITDGRDTPPKAAMQFFDQLIPLLDERCKLATIIGRYYAMDRDNRIDRTLLAYNAIIKGEAEQYFTDIKSCIEDFYMHNITDEFFKPSCIKQYPGLQQNDTIILCNYRADRMRQITQMLHESTCKNINIISMVDFFDKKLPTIKSIFSNKIVHNTLGEILSQNNKQQLRIAETEKYAHVTFFLNCGTEVPYIGEKRILIPSPRIATYDLQPEMSAYIITNKLCAAINSKIYDFICVNFANADMIGHTGNMQAARQACDVLNECLEKLVQTTSNNNCILLITADHGNIEQMFDITNNQPHTAHTLNPVPLICIGNNIIKLTNGMHGLQDVAPTVLKLLNIAIPNDMTGIPLFSTI